MQWGETNSDSSSSSGTDVYGIFPITFTNVYRAVNSASPSVHFWVGLKQLSVNKVTFTIEKSTGGTSQNGSVHYIVIGSVL